MRYLPLVLLAMPAFAQKGDGDSPVLQKLLLEVQQLRLAIERSTLLGARTQLALTRLQIEEGAATRVSQQLNDVRQQGLDLSHKREQESARKKQLEEKMSSEANPEFRRDLEAAIKNIALELEELAAGEQDRSTRESELANQLQAAQNQLVQTRAQIGEMERSLDAAILQLIQPR